MSDMPGPNETRLNLIDGVEYITLRADDFRTTMADADAAGMALVQENERLHTENQRLNQALDMLAEERAAWEADNERLRAALREIEGLPLGRRWTSCDIAEAALAHPKE
jgi:hypothetical protein